VYYPERSKKLWAKRLAGPPRETFDAPDEVPVWDDLYYPPLNTLADLPSHPKNYVWPRYNAEYFRPSDYNRCKPFVLTTSLKLFSAEHDVRPWAPMISHSKHPLGSNRVPLDDLGPALKNLPAYIPFGTPVLARNYSDYDANIGPKTHGRVTYCHWCARPFASLGLLMNLGVRKNASHRILPDDPDGVVRHYYCSKHCHRLWGQYCTQFSWRVTYEVDEARDRFSKSVLPQRQKSLKTTHKWNLNKTYSIRWDFLQRFLSPTQEFTVNDIIPRSQKTPPVTKIQRNKLRQQIYRDTEDMVRMAKAVLAGDHEWNSSQVQVFKSLMNKVLPDAHVAEEHTEEAKSLDNLSTEDLERLIAETEGVTPTVIDHEPDLDTDLDPQPTTIIHPSEDDDPNAPV
jgi:hypothetical protein